MEKISPNTKHPKELVFFGLSRTFERMSYYGIKSLLVVYMISNALNFTESKSVEIYSYFTTALMITPLLGAILGDLLLGNRMASLAGLLLNILGAIVLLVPNPICLYTSLVLIALGDGLYIPNFNAQLGKYYLDRDKLMDAGFTIIYSLINVSAFLGVFLIGSFQRDMMPLGLCIAIVIYTLALFFQLKIKNPSDETKSIHGVNQTNWKVIGLIAIGLSIFWVVSDFVQAYYDKTRLAENGFEEITLLNFNNFKTVLGIVVGLLACFIWSRYYLSITRKLNYILIALLMTLMIPLSFTLFNTPTIAGQFYPSLIVLTISEIILAPLVYVLVLRNANTKYVAITSSLVLIVMRLFQTGFYEFQLYFMLTDSILLITVALALASYLIVFYTAKKMTLRN